MINIKESESKIILDILSKNLKSCKVYAFGSRVKGNNKEYSDIDLLFVGEFSEDEIINTKSDFEISDLPFRADIVIYNELDEGFKTFINESKEIIFEA